MSPTVFKPTHSKTIAARLPSDRLTGGLAWLLALIHVLVLLSLLAILATADPAKAADDPACGARDLMAELEKSDPSAYAKLRAEGARIKNSGTRFWRLDKPGKPPSYLLGTMHVSDPRVTGLPDVAKAAYDASATIIVESDEILDQQKAAAKLWAKPDMMMFSGTASIKDYLKPGEQEILEAGLAKRGMPFASVVKMKPWIIASMVSLSPCELSRKANGAAFLDQKLAQDAVAAGKSVTGLETLTEQLDAMASLPMEFHVRSLVAAVRYPDYTANMMETTLQLYLDGNIGMVFPAGAYFAPEKNESDFRDMALFEEKLITVRNHHMADRAAAILADGNVFMAVGALHLVGDQGVVELFRKQGFTLTPIL